MSEKFYRLRDAYTWSDLISTIEDANDSFIDGEEIEIEVGREIDVQWDELFGVPPSELIRDALIEGHYEYFDNNVVDLGIDGLFTKEKLTKLEGIINEFLDNEIGKFKTLELVGTEKYIVGSGE